MSVTSFWGAGRLLRPLASWLVASHPRSFTGQESLRSWAPRNWKDNLSVHKTKGVRELVEALSAATRQNAHGFFALCGYATPRVHSL